MSKIQIDATHRRHSILFNSLRRDNVKNLLISYNFIYSLHRPCLYRTFEYHTTPHCFLMAYILVFFREGSNVLIYLLLFSKC